MLLLAIILANIELLNKKLSLNPKSKYGNNILRAKEDESNQKYERTIAVCLND
jgi:hypothetical protein